LHDFIKSTFTSRVSGIANIAANKGHAVRQEAGEKIGGESPLFGKA